MRKVYVMNNFKELEDDHEHENDLNNFHIGIEEKKVASTYFFFRHIGNVVDHFLGRAVDMFVSFSGGEAGPKAPPDQGNDPFEDIPPRGH